MDTLNTPTIPGMTVDQFTLGELRELRANVERAIEQQREAGKRKALASIAQLARDAELSPDEVMAHLAPRPNRGRSKLPPKYRDPAAPHNSWAGRGKRPKWLEARLAEGAKLEDFLIRGPSHGNPTA